MCKNLMQNVNIATIRSINILVIYHYEIQYKFNVLLHVAKLTGSNVSCSENVVYDAVGSTVKTSTQDNMTCSKNIAYATIKQDKRMNWEPFLQATWRWMMNYRQPNNKCLLYILICTLLAILNLTQYLWFVGFECGESKC